jgi:hypothetical protein
MPRIVRTARGELVDFDAVIIKQQLAEAPMNVEVANRKKFIDTQEAKKRGQRATAPTPTATESTPAPVTELARPVKSKK